MYVQMQGHLEKAIIFIVREFMIIYLGYYPSDRLWYRQKVRKRKKRPPRNFLFSLHVRDCDYTQWKGEISSQI